MNIRFLSDPEWPINNIDRKDYLSDAAIKGNMGASLLARARAERFITDSPDLFVQKKQRRSARTLPPCLSKKRRDEDGAP